MQIELGSKLIDTETYKRREQGSSPFPRQRDVALIRLRPMPTVEMLASAKSPVEFYTGNIRGKFETPGNYCERKGLRAAGGAVLARRSKKWAP
jgi:hypothetical protein